MLRSISVALVALYLCAASFDAVAQKEKGAKAPSQEEMMKRWQVFMTPADAHARLMKMAGTWNVENKIWMGGPGSEAQTSTGTAVYSEYLGGRYLKQEMNATMMQMPYHGFGVFGYDNFKKKYTGFWIDDMSTAISVMEGSYDEKSRSIVFWGKMDEPMTGEKDKKVKYIVRIENDDTHYFEIYDVQTYGEKQPVMQVKYTRAK
ncbi:MAG: DUF1579 domain-containing protein [Ignavibacteriae bacterium]|nr:DUF1579 domain-containing protein [Ignavibacteriota bacterium]